MHQKLETPDSISKLYDMESQETLKTVYKLCKALDDLGINYCHWKSNAALDRSASGDNDLDLLVSRSDASLFISAMSKLGFKESLPTSSMQLPGIQHYYCYDVDADKFVHIHAHFQLIIGSDWTKNYHLPIERLFLQTATHESLFRVPECELEFILFVIRMVLKFSILDIFLNRRLALSTSAQRELEYLQSKISRARIHYILEKHLIYIDLELFNNCVNSIQRGSSIWSRLKARNRLQKKLVAYSRRSLISDSYLKLSRLVITRLRWRLFRQLSRKRLANGGAIVALVGGDGAGKSTAIEGLYAWLSENFDTRKVHMGKPPRSLTTSTLVSILKIGSFVNNLMNGDTLYHSSVNDKSNGRSGGDRDTDAASVINVDLTNLSTASSAVIKISGYLRLLLNICTARDRYRTYKRARRYASNGGFVICDRFPLSQVKLMDQPTNGIKINTEKTTRIIRFLTLMAHKYQQGLMLPELLIILKVAPDIAVKRKPDEDAAFVYVRSKEIWDLDWEQTCANVIDASQSREDVLSEIKSLMWSEI
jgi:thymidylate kinase